MESLHFGEVDVKTYQFVIQKNIFVNLEMLSWYVSLLRV